MRRAHQRQRPLLFLIRESERQTGAGDLDLPLRTDQHLVRPKIAVNHSVPVQVVQSLRHRHRHVHRGSRREWGDPADALFQIDPPHVLLADVGALVRPGGFVHAGEVRVAERNQRLCALQNSPGDLGIRGVVRPEHLDGGQAVHHPVSRPVDGEEPPFTRLLQHLVAEVDDLTHQRLHQRLLPRSSTRTAPRTIPAATIASQAAHP
jgi:hypothetical protein